MKWLTGQQAADLLQISRRSLYRWMAEGRLPQHLWTVEYIAAHQVELGKRPRGPARNPLSIRYGPRGRHSFTRGLR